MQDFALPSDRLASQRKDIVQTHGWKQRIYRKGRYCTQGLQVQQGRKQARVCNHPNMTFHHPTRTSGSAPITGREGHRKPQGPGQLRNIAKRKHQPLSGRFRVFSARFPAGKTETSDFFEVKCRGLLQRIPMFWSGNTAIYGICATFTADFEPLHDGITHIFCIINQNLWHVQIANGQDSTQNSLQNGCRGLSEFLKV